MATYFCPLCRTYAEALAGPDPQTCSCGAERVLSLGEPLFTHKNMEPSTSDWVSPIENERESQAVVIDDVIEAEVLSEPDIGLWRDEQWLVIRNAGAQFPARCVKTNQPSHQMSKQILLHEPLPGGAWWAVLFGFIGVLVAQSAGKSTPVHVPLSPQWLNDYQNRGRRGWTIILAGIVGFLFVTFFAIVAASADSSLFPWIMGCLALCPLISFTGIFYLGLQHKPILSAVKITQQFTWVEGVSAEFLASLPMWDGPHLGTEMI